MMQSFESAGNFGKEFMDQSLKSLAAVSKGVQAIAVEASEYSRRSFENGSAALEELVTAKSLERTVEIQAGYARSAYEGFIAEATKMSELYADLFRDAYKPFETAAKSQAQ